SYYCCCALNKCINFALCTRAPKTFVFKIMSISLVSKKTLWKFNRLSCIINLAKQFNFYVLQARHNCQNYCTRECIKQYLCIYLMHNNTTKKPRSTRKTTGVLFMIMVVLLIVVVKRKSEYRRHLIIGNQHQVELPYIGHKLYVDPTIYDSPEDALNDFASELDPSVLVLEKLIGGGEFGDVYKGIMKCNEGKALTVAVKTLKTDHTAKNETDFLLEASVMGQFDDPNVIRLEGVITRSFPRMIVTEYMSNGSLDRFLRLNDDNLTELQLIGMARGVASGMAYLSAMNFIHRDLAARNILVNDDLLCKIADFGLSRSLGDEGSDGEYSISGGKIPVRWTAPEVIAYRKFSSSSDVWSYGILLWEIMSFGDRPYWEWDNTKVMKEVENGFRLPPPKDCPRGIHNLMLSCWKANRSERPKFEHISQVMNGWIRSPETINEDPQESVIGDWLHSIKMGDYTSLFLSAGYESPYQLAGIGNEDLLKIGVKLIGHRNKILKAIKALKSYQNDRNNWLQNVLKNLELLKLNIMIQKTLTSGNQNSHNTKSVLKTGSKKEIIDNDILESTSFQTFNVNGKGEGWSFIMDEQHVKTCGIGSTADFWFVTKFVDLGSSYADVIYVDVEAGFILCDDPGTRKKVQCFSNYFEVYINRGKDKPVVSEDNLLKLFSPVHNITNNTSLSTTLSKQTQTFSFNPNDTKGVTFAVRSKGACGKILNMTMYYYYCEETYIHSVRLKRTASPMSGSKLVTANCSQNSLASNNMTRLEGYCYSNGSWSMNNDFECSCIEGHESSTNTGCSLCKSDSFKQNVSNTECTKCPPRSTSIENRTSCTCRDGYYKSPLDQNVLSPCYGLPKLKERPMIEINKTSAHITITWSKPDTTESLNEMISYDVECFLCEEKICKSPCSTNVMFIPSNDDLHSTFVVVTKLQPGRTYVFRVYPKNILNKRIPKDKWNFLETEHFTHQSSKQPNSEGGSDKTGSIVIAVIAVVLFALIILLVIFAFRRRGTKKNKPLRTFLNNGVDLPNAGMKPYVDPTNYSNAEEAVEEFANELDPRFIFLERLIGGGEFGDVYKGELTGSNGKKIQIAVKTLKHDASSKSSRDFMLEASVMAQFDYPNVVKMEGVITKTKPRMIVIEYMSNGSLDNYLKNNDGMLTRLQLLGMARDVAAGMNYLAEIKFVHRDLAARNVLVNDAMLCKISDFGLSRELETTETQSLGEYATTGGKIPIRWTAPEAIKYRKFSTASDVWSFGILLWEIMSFAQRPYWEWDNFKVMEEVDDGFRLPSPQKCPFGVHSLMLQCWKAERGGRPSFAQITIVIDRWIRSPETMDDEANFFITISDWLTSIKMGSYKTMFIEAGYTKQSEIIDLTDADLKTIGITLIGHRNKIMKARYQVSGRRCRRVAALKS
ncbi:ephrin type-A receptor 5 isoform X5, partial [Paramuricea clavata]